MNIERHNKILGLLWLMFGVGDSVSLTVQLSQALISLGSEIFARTLESFLIAIVVSLLTFLSGWALFKRKSWGRIAIGIIWLKFQPSLRDGDNAKLQPGVETPGCSQPPLTRRKPKPFFPKVS